jgi:hydroxyacylglutathione hydrolase
VSTDHHTGNQLDALSTPKLPVWGGKDCDHVTFTPSHMEELAIGSIKVTPLHTPCHTQDSICWFMEDGDDRVVFTGDTLFISGTYRILFRDWLAIVVSGRSFLGRKNMAYLRSTGRSGDCMAADS